MANTREGPGELCDLKRVECFRLLASGRIGRVVFTDAALPAVQPVAYFLDDEEVVFRTRNGSKLAAATRHAIVGFEVDEFDLQARTGWSVLGIGQPTKSSIRRVWPNLRILTVPRGCATMTRT